MTARRGLHMPSRREAQYIPPEKHPPYHGPWQDKVTNADVLSRTGLPIQYVWHTLSLDMSAVWVDRIPKDILSRELALGRRTTVRSHIITKGFSFVDKVSVPTSDN